MLNEHYRKSGKFENGAIPAVLLTTQGTVPPAEKERVQSAWQKMFSGVQKAFRTAVLEQGLTPTVIGQPIKDLAMPELESTRREQIMAAFKIPPGLSQPLASRAERQALMAQLTLTSYKETRPMTDKALIPTDQDHSPAEYRDRQEVAVIGKRLKAMMPGGDKLSDSQAMALAQYAMLLDANPFRGEVYGYTDRHGFHLVDGYKMLVRWARKQCPYTESYKEIPDLPKEAIGFRCYILRQDARPALQEFVQMGATFEQAYELATVSAVGIVTKSDMTTRDNRPMDPPAGWTWEQVAKKRALKNALNLSHGAPSPREIAAQSWEINGQQTTASDWEDVTPDMPQYEREAIAEKTARMREAHEHAQELMDGGMTGDDAINELYGDYIEKPDFHGAPMDELAYDDLVAGDDEYIAEAIKPPAPAQRVGKDPAELIAKGKAAEPADPPHWIDDARVRGKFWAMCGNLGLDNEATHAALGVEHVRDFGGTMQEAKALLDAAAKVTTDQVPA